MAHSRTREKILILKYPTDENGEITTTERYTFYTPMAYSHTAESSQAMERHLRVPGSHRSRSHGKNLCIISTPRRSDICPSAGFAKYFGSYKESIKAPRQTRVCRGAFYQSKRNVRCIVRHYVAAELRLFRRNARHICSFPLNTRPRCPCIPSCGAL